VILIKGVIQHEARWSIAAAWANSPRPTPSIGPGQTSKSIETLFPLKNSQPMFMTKYNTRTQKFPMLLLEKFLALQYIM
jgi:hypothetical protein